MCAEAYYNLRFSWCIVLALPLKLELWLIIFFLHSIHSLVNKMQTMQQ